MKIAIFLDVDKTVTERNIQETYAVELGILEVYQKIEQDFQDLRINSVGFGERLIPEFAKQGFTRARAEELFDQVNLRSGIEKLFTWGQKGVDIFLVSSGPNYYVEHLAAKQNIIKEHVLCSQYLFDSKGVISKCFAIEDRPR